MKKDRNLISIITALVCICCIQVSSARAEEAASPASVVKEFAKAYFMLDDSMAAYLSKDALLNEAQVDMVDLYLDQKEFDAHSQGYRLSYFQMLPLNMKANVVSRDDTSAKVEFSATNVRSINPLYRIIGFVFCLMDEHEVKETITLVKEDGAWKIEPGAFDLPRPI